MGRWPKKVKHRRKVLAKIYRPCKGRESYRVTWYAAGKRQMKSFATYAGERGAKEFAETKVKELANNPHAAMLSPSQATDALAAIERLQAHVQATGRRFSLVSSVSQFCEADVKVNGRLLTDVADGFMTTVVSVKRKDLIQAVKDFIALDEPRTAAQPGQRPEIEPRYLRQKRRMLEKFATMLPGHAVCDVTKSHIDMFINGLSNLPTRRKNLPKPSTPKSRNHYRGSLRMFIEWATRQDYLPQNHRLLEAESMKPEKTNRGETLFYTPKELRDLLEAADGPVQALMAIGGLAGLRTAELLRLDWADVWHVSGHIEVTAGKSKTRSRRLVKMVPALAKWLSPFRQFKTGKLWAQQEQYFHEQVAVICDEAKVKRKANALRHSFCTYHFALDGNENLTAQQAGNSPAMIHGHYKGLATKKEAKAWFAIKPAKTAANVIRLPQKEGVA
jgi:integrase